MSFIFIKHLKGRFSTLFHVFLVSVPLLFSSNLLHANQTIGHSQLDIELGRAIFEKLWVFSPASTKSSDGLGPLYNARSCHQCHSNIRYQGALPHSLVIQLGTKQQSLLDAYRDSNYGQQIQTFAYPGGQAEARIELRYEIQKVTLSGGQQVELRRPLYKLSDLSYGKLDNQTRSSARIAPRMQGLGWIDSIPDKDIQAMEDSEDINKDGISGKINWVWDNEKHQPNIGRFGWKASKPSLNQQNLAALVIDIGVSSWLFPNPEGDCTQRQSKCVQLAQNTLSDPSGQQPNPIEASEDMTKLLLSFTATMNAKNLLDRQKKDGNLEGRGLFSQLACSTCHQPVFSNIQNHYSNEHGSISPYSDLLLHDMGAGLADERSEFQAEGYEWRTTPLWGLAAYLATNPQPVLLHDGRARSVLEAILWHGGEAENSKQAFVNLSETKRQQLIDFVESL